MKYLALFPSWIPMMRFIAHDRILAFLEKVVKYATTDGGEPKFDSDAERNVFEAIRVDIDRSKSVYNRKCEVMRRNGRKGGIAKRDNARMNVDAEIGMIAENIA